MLNIQKLKFKNKTRKIKKELWQKKVDKLPSLMFQKMT